MAARATIVGWRSLLGVPPFARMRRARICAAGLVAAGWDMRDNAGQTQTAARSQYTPFSLSNLLYAIRGHHRNTARPASIQMNSDAVDQLH